MPLCSVHGSIVGAAPDSYLYTVSTEILIQKVRSTVSATPPCPSCGRRDKRGWARWACSAQPFWKTAKLDIELLDYCTCLRFLQRVILQNLENLLANRQNLNSFFSGENIECRVYHDALVKNEFLTVSTRSFTMSEPRASIARMESGTFGDDQVTKLSTKIKPVTRVK